jgi:hypothetical protein
MVKMNNEITIDLDKVRNAEDFSITDPETIRQIALLHQKGENLFCKVNPRFAVHGLYPNVVERFENIKPETLNETEDE